MQLRAPLASAVLLAVLLGGLVADAQPARLAPQALAGLLPISAPGDAGAAPPMAAPPAALPAAPPHVHLDETGRPVAAGAARRIAVAPAPPPVQVWPPGVQLQPAAQAMPGGGCGPVRNTGAPALQFCCPAVTPDGGILGPSNTDPSDRTDVSGCPFRVYDGTAGPPFGFQFGNAQIAVNPAAEGEVIFTSLHSAADDAGSTPRSRTPSQTHTAFTSSDQGLSWSDQPIGGSPGAAGYGESSAVAMDREGNTYIAYLWSGGGGNESTGYASTIGLFKAASTREAFTVSQSYDSGTVIEGRGPRNPIPRIHLAFVPPYAPPPGLNATAGNLTGGPARPEEIGEAAVGGANRTGERVAAVWLERAPEPPYGPHGYPGWIDAAVTHTGGEASWSRLPERSLIGPCLDASNPVAFNGLVFVACVADKGYGHRPRARIGDTDIWAIDPLTGNATLVDSTYVVGGHPVLAATPDGYFALASTRLRGPDGADVQLAFSWYGRHWNRLGDVGQTLHALAGAQPVHDVHVTALSLSEQSKVVALVYMEWQQAGPATQPQPPPPPDPANPGAAVPALADYKKIIAVGVECSPTFPLAAARLQTGTGIDPTNFAAYQERPSIYDDFQDGLVNYREPTGEDVWYFAANDYGAMQFGAVRPNSVAANCPIAPPPLPPAPAAVPQALSLASPANLAMGATVGAAAVAMVLYLLAVKRRAASTAVAEDK